MTDATLKRLIPFTGLLTGLLIIVTGCEMTEGYGGSASIEGTVITKYYNDDYSELIREVPAVDLQVFLLFGDDEVVGDEIETSATGRFAFRYLTPGHYSVYFESEDTSSLDRINVPVTKEVELAAGDELDLGVLYEFEALDFDDGSATISGTIMLINYKNTTTFPNLEIKDTSPAQEQEVYLVYGEHQYYDERIRTGYDGYFEFRNLIPGKYEVYTYSEDVDGGGTADIPVIETVEITEEKEVIDLGVIYIEQL